MKIAARILTLVLLASLTTFFIGCKPDPDPGPSETDKQITQLNGSWKVSAATLDGVAPTLDHSNMVLTISGATGNNIINYTVSGRPVGPSAWPSSGTFKFGSNVKQNLDRGDTPVVPVTYSVTDTKLTIDFDFTGTPYTSSGRVASVSGQWHFEFTKQ
jgi:hypothetical protein